MAVVETAWTQGFFPGLLWLLVERQRLATSTVDPSHMRESIKIASSSWLDLLSIMTKASGFSSLMGSKLANVGKQIRTDA
jgi:hypothetical protein